MRPVDVADKMGTPAQRRAWWILNIGADAYDEGYRNGLTGKDPMWAEIDTADSWCRRVNAPHKILFAAYRRGWTAGDKAREAHEEHKARQ